MTITYVIKFNSLTPHNRAHICIFWHCRNGNRNNWKPMETQPLFHYNKPLYILLILIQWSQLFCANSRQTVANVHITRQTTQTTKQIDGKQEKTKLYLVCLMSNANRDDMRKKNCKKKLRKNTTKPGRKKSKNLPQKFRIGQVPKRKTRKKNSQKKAKKNMKKSQNRKKAKNISQKKNRRKKQQPGKSTLKKTAQGKSEKNSQKHRKIG